MADRLLLVVEGPDDKHVLWAILGITKRCFDPDGPHVSQFLAWLKRRTVAWRTARRLILRPARRASEGRRPRNLAGASG